MAKKWKILKEANEGITIGFLLTYRIKSEFPEVTPFSYFSFHADQGIRLKSRMLKKNLSSTEEDTSIMVDLF